jgi:hypothetical protein
MHPEGLPGVPVLLNTNQMGCKFQILTGMLGLLRTPSLG